MFIKIIPYAFFATYLLLVDAIFAIWYNLVIDTGRPAPVKTIYERVKDPMKKLVSLLLSLCLVLGCVAFASADGYTPGTYEATAQGFGGDVKATVTVDDSTVTAVEITGDAETPTVGGAAIPELINQILEKQSAEIDGVAGATLTSNAVKEAAAKALALAAGDAEAPAEEAALAFTAGDYEVTTDGYNGPVTFKVTFSDTALTGVEVVSSMETGHVGTPAFGIMIADMIEANGSGVDGVSGATFSGRALKTAVNEAAEQAGCTNLDAFKAAKVEHPAQDPIEKTADIIVVGGGGAGMAAAAQATQNGDTVLVLEKNAEVGGNTLVSGGQFQSVMPYLVWDPADPDATTGVYGRDGQSYEKIMSVPGCINELKIILNWSEEPFDEEFYKTNEFVAGDAAELSKHGVHAEYLPVLQELKKEIQAYLDWAEPKLAEGLDESKL
ncbi:MAG: FAD-dependent oxidoreductase, partial [Verrucomicrobia bacterium]|nr:FAD-dependent oxidoreductase [Verrucomicrobiota bacterium]